MGAGTGTAEDASAAAAAAAHAGDDSGSALSLALISTIMAALAVEEPPSKPQQTGRLLNGTFQRLVHTAYTSGWKPVKSLPLTHLKKKLEDTCNLKPPQALHSSLLEAERECQGALQQDITA